jgi:hypothetical protein
MYSEHARDMLCEGSQYLASTRSMIRKLGKEHREEWEHYMHTDDDPEEEEERKLQQEIEREFRAYSSPPRAGKPMRASLKQKAGTGHVCKRCREMFKSKKRLARHLTVTGHELPVPVNSNGHPLRYTCEACRTSFAYMRELKEHLLSDSHIAKLNPPAKVEVTSTFACELCKRSYATKQGLNSHCKSQKHLKALAIFRHAKTTVGKGSTV